MQPMDRACAIGNIRCMWGRRACASSSRVRGVVVVRGKGMCGNTRCARLLVRASHRMRGIVHLRAPTTCFGTRETQPVSLAGRVRVHVVRDAVCESVQTWSLCVHCCKPVLLDGFVTAWRGALESSIGDSSHG